MNASTKEPQYATCLDIDQRVGRTRLGLMTNQVWHDDPKRLCFVLARYKFVAKMLSGTQRVLEVGCADAFGTRIVQQEVGSVTVTDFDPVFIADVNARQSERWPLTAVLHDMLQAPFPGQFDGAYAIDVLEHIPREQEQVFLGNMIAPLTAQGVCLIGSPSIQSQAYASPPSKAGHVNCKNAPELKALMQTLFHNVFLFSMNDEVVHTGYHAMAHYLWALGVGKK
jgi:cyclopropane fatty-acyl-phospholipid synthase-like methyltransferase